MSAVSTQRPVVSVKAAVLGTIPGAGMSFSVFAQLSESVALAARQVGLAPPGFQSLTTGTSVRLVRRTPAGPIILVRVRGRSTGAVLLDLVEGVLAVNDFQLIESPDGLERPEGEGAGSRRRMLALLAAEGWPISEDLQTERTFGVQAA